jgi:hypothetical protein
LATLPAAGPVPLAGSGSLLHTGRLRLVRHDVRVTVGSPGAP